MSVHVSVRLSWHDTGWNGRICRNPKANAYCVGPYSYPGDLIATKRDLEWEEKSKGRSCAEIFEKEGKTPPCCLSINAFGEEEIHATSDPPDFFKDNTRTKTWRLPRSSVCSWPYEEMYKAEVKNSDGTYDYKRRLEEGRRYFSFLEPHKSLIFYYVNYSNPFSENDRKRYVIVGVSRLEEIGEELFYEGCSEETKRKYAGGFVWQRVVSSFYPEQGLRLPYHLYTDSPDVSERLAFFPDNPRNFKYGTRHIGDDDALDLIERFVEITGTLLEIGDATENWGERLKWLNSVIAELWRSRGLYPGLPKALDYIGFHEAIGFYKQKASQWPDLAVGSKQEIFRFLRGEGDKIVGLELSDTRKEKILRRWKLKTDTERSLLENVIVRLDLDKEHIERVLSDGRREYGIYSSLEEIVHNPYVLSEQYVGSDPDDFISFNKIDYGVLPSPELGGRSYSDFEKDDARRLRALCVQQLKTESHHTFISGDRLIERVNHKLSHLPEWKRHVFNTRYFEIDEQVLSEALVFRRKNGDLYAYLRTNYDYEREIEGQIRALARRPNIELRSPVTREHWRDFLFDPGSPILKTDPEKYDEIVDQQAVICGRIFIRPVAVISGGAGTGKTTIVRAIIRAVEKTCGTGATILVLAPTGKAAERLRAMTGRQALTIHSLLASYGWLNENMTFKRRDGRQVDAATVIIDEASMLDLTLLGTLFRVINWAVVKRLLFVGDPNQLPPIGRGRVFADILDWLQETGPGSLGTLEISVRQLVGQIEGRGTGILELASLYVRRQAAEQQDSETKMQAEMLLRRVQDGGDVDKDLRALYWNGHDDLREKLVKTVIADLERETSSGYDPDNPFELYAKAFGLRGQGNQKPHYMQLISPYRGEFFGTESINTWMQEALNRFNREKKGNLSGITYFDKVIQCRNRTKSNPIKAFNTESRKQEDVEIFNGEIGFVKPHGFDHRKWERNWFTLRKFQVVFERKKESWVEYGSGSEVEDNLELAYAISVHKSQGSEFERIYFILPRSKQALLITELFYTGITRASSHCTLLIEEDISPLLRLRRAENSQLARINSSLFEFSPVPDELLTLSDWYQEGRIHKALTGLMVRSKSEVIIANLLHDRYIPFEYEVPLWAPDGTFYLPDFTIRWRGEVWYWEHLGMLYKECYRKHWETKKEWYSKHGFSRRLIISDEEEGMDSEKLQRMIDEYFK